MLKRLGPHLTYANVAATLALIIAVAGGTTAIAISTKLKKGSVRAQSIRNGNVTAPKLAGVRIVIGPTNKPAICGPNDRLIGGGIKGTPGGAGTIPSVLSSYPDGNAWVATGGNNVNVEAYVLCLSGTPGP